jgi:hypothetical protein
MNKVRRWLVEPLIALLLVCCGGGYKNVLVTEERPAGTCAETQLKPKESCEASVRDYSIGGSLLAPQEGGGDMGAFAFYRGPISDELLTDVLVDTRSLGRAGDSSRHRSAAIGTSIHFRPLLVYWPQLFRYLDINTSAGGHLGATKVHSRVRGRFDGFVGAAIEVYPPDFEALRYFDNGIPGLRVGVQHTWYVEEWNSDTTLEFGLVWRWGTPVDLLTTWQRTRTGD